MECEVKKARYLSEISTVAELKEARRELELREWFAGERLAEDIAETFTLENMISIVAPPGSVLDRVIGGVGTGFTAIQGIMGVVGSFLWGKGSGGRTPVRAVHPRASHRPQHSTHATRGKTTGGRSHTSRKRTPEIEVEVELEEPKGSRGKR